MIYELHEPLLDSPQLRTGIAARARIYSPPFASLCAYVLVRTATTASLTTPTLLQLSLASPTSSPIWPVSPLGHQEASHRLARSPHHSLRSAWSVFAFTPPSPSLFPLFFPPSLFDRRQALGPLA
mmetsp:Transcript_9859/g.20864  ORF Transcript_9859/g.20864 Transcript_9859/m.20864 type:complete len:125 (+) Transcript_9859:26-400(+)